MKNHSLRLDINEVTYLAGLHRDHMRREPNSASSCTPENNHTMHIRNHKTNSPRNSIPNTVQIKECQFTQSVELLLPRPRRPSPVLLSRGIRRHGDTRLAMRAGGRNRSSRRSNLSRRQSQGNVAVGRVLPGPPTLLLPRRGRGRVDAKPSAAARPQRSVEGARARAHGIQRLRCGLLLGHRVVLEPARIGPADHRGGAVAVVVGCGGGVVGDGREVGIGAHHDVGLLRRRLRWGFPGIH